MSSSALPMPSGRAQPSTLDLTHDAAHTILSRLRGLVRTYVLFEGAALVVAILGLAFWVSLGLDRWLELSIPIRMLVLIATLGSIFAAVLVLVMQRFFFAYNPRALALVLERRFPHLDDRLITTIELADRRSGQTHLTQSMLDRTADELSGLMPKIRMGEVFNLGPLMRAILFAIVLLGSVGAFSVYATETASLWFQRNVLMSDEYWPRKTGLHVHVLAEPGERVREFTRGVYKHPQGQNLTLVADVPEGKVVPQFVQLVYVLENGTRKTEDLIRVGEGRSFRHTLAGLQSNAQLWFYAGDYASRTPLLVRTVPSPGFEKIGLECTYPRYTQKESKTELVQGMEITIPAATEFILRANTNKPIQGFELVGDTFTLQYSKAGGAVLKQPADAKTGTPLNLKVPLLAEDGRSFGIPCLLTTKPADQLGSLHGPAIPLKLPPTANLTLSLHDVDDILSPEPSRLTIHSQPDVAPTISAELKGIGRSITRQATIPIVGSITDDYAVIAPRFEFKLDTQSAWEPLAFLGEMTPRPVLDFKQSFKVLPLDLAVGQKLTLTVSAADASDPPDILNLSPLSVAGLTTSMFAPDQDEFLSPHRVQGDKFTFEIVTSEELLSQIAVRELNLRQRFEQILVEVKARRTELAVERSKWSPMGNATPAQPAGGTAEKVDPRERALELSQRATSGNAKNLNESTSIELAFRDIRDELQNNAVPDVKALLERIDEGIVNPLNSVNTKDYPRIDDGLTALRQSLEVKENPSDRFELVLDSHDELITKLEGILAQMHKLESYNEAVQLLREIIKGQEDVKKKTADEIKREAIKKLQGLQ